MAAALADMAIAAVAVASTAAIPEAISAFHVAAAAVYGCCGRLTVATSACHLVAVVIII